MKVHYINILLFALPLNILVTLCHKHNQRNHKSTTLHTQNNRSLCECELYAPANYDSDTEMKSVMENFSKQTQQRFHEYDERMKTTRQKCREQCDKEIQKIILKDKLEKELMDKFATLQTDIQSDAIPICVCEKSIADKVEKGCLRCGGLLGGGIAPGWGLVSGLGYVGWTNYVPQIAMQKGIEEGVKAGFEGLKSLPGLPQLIKESEIQSLINPANYAEKTTYVSFVEKVKTTECAAVAKGEEIFCDFVAQVEERIVAKQVSGIADNAARMAKITKAGVLKEGASATSSLTTAIIASVIAIVVIVLIMVIIYLILRYRRKKKMKKKLQYIKLLEE
ncbi:PIR protein, putative [Plasmodium sp. gorilla clade G1]|nr:PIR protein, putative [Plasmodium sp. gorilla clade G1]